ncbi:MAG: hypothetical protein PSV36_15165 [Algoriphagus sp.]|nr:hypothetical protein [Algoriphagus sp.]
MKKFCMIAILLFGLSPVFAQEFFLPVSTTSEIAKQAYQDAIMSTQHVDLTQYGPLMKTAIENDPEFFMAYTHRGIRRLNATNQELPKADITKALSISQDKLTPSEVILRKALVLLNEDLKADISGMIKELALAYPTTPQVYDMGLFVNHFVKKDYAEAVKNGEMLVKLSPSYGSSYNLLGYANMAAGDMKAAKSAFKNYIKTFPKEANPYDSMGEYYMNVKDYKKSAKNYDKAAEMGMETSKELADKARSMIE